MNISDGQLYGEVVGALFIALLGTLRVLGGRRLRVRGSLPETPALRTARRALASALAVTALGLALLLTRAAGGPAWLRPMGIGVAGLGYVTLAAALGAVLRERLRRPRRRRSRPAT